MHSSRTNILAQEAVRQTQEVMRLVEEERRRVALKEAKQSCRVPGEPGTASDTQSSEGELLVEPSNYNMRRKPTVKSVDQIAPLSILRPYVSVSTARLKYMIIIIITIVF